LNAAFVAAALPRFGDAGQLALRIMPPPVPGRGQVVVQVRAAAVNPIDVRRRGGYGRRMLAVLGAARLPLVLGNDCAGVVCAVGAGEAGLREGDPVFGAKPPSSAGTHASHVVVDARHLLLQPPGVPEQKLACLPYNFLTVKRALAGAGIADQRVCGREVLVHGASGGLGLIALRLLRQMGARVTAVASVANHDLCQLAGATSVLDRHSVDLRCLPARYAATLNFGSWDDEADLIGLLGPGALGHASTVHPLLASLDRRGVAAGLASAWLQRRRLAALVPAGARYDWTVFRPDDRVLAGLADLAPLLAVPTCVVPFALAQAAAAHLHVEQRRRGRAVLLPQS
jgi:NADPH:quinone reductase-like Zn-dependent oxidoreductase